MQPQLPSDAVARMAEACVAPADRGRMMDSYSTEERRALLLCAQAQTARMINEQLPMRLDDLTTMEEVRAEGPMLVYVIRLNLDEAAVTQAARSAVHEAAVRFACANPDMSRTIASGGAYDYRWLDRRGIVVQRTTISTC